MTSVHVFGNQVPNLTEGISRNVDSLVRSLRAGGDDVRLAAAYNPLEAMNHRRSLVLGGIRAARLASRALRDPAVDLVHYHVSLASLAVFSQLARLQGRKPLFVHAWNAMLEPETPAIAGLALQRLANGPHATRLALAGVRHLLVSSRYQEQQIRSLGLGAKVHVVPNGVDTTAFAPASRSRREQARTAVGVDSAPVILYYGHLSPWKGVDTLMSALQEVLPAAPHATGLLSVTSYGGQGAALAWQAARMGLAGRVVTRGPTPVPVLHAAADIAVIPARAAVGTACHPNVLLECMAAGLPVIASNVGSIPEVVEHGRNGLLVPPGDAAALAAAIRLLMADPALGRRLGQAARQTMVDHFGWNAVAAQVRDIYRDAGVGADGYATPHADGAGKTVPTPASMGLTSNVPAAPPIPLSPRAKAPLEIPT